MQGQTIITTHDVDELFISTIVRLIQRRAFPNLQNIIAATVGTLIPMLFRRIRIDPAVATGPFVTTAIDVLGIFTYFLFAEIFLFYWIGGSIENGYRTENRKYIT